jgi:hypothetical protein
MKKNMSILNLYAKPGYKMTLWQRIEWWYKRHKCARQRARWGFSEYDVWDLDCYLSELIGDMAKYLAEHNMSHPYDVTTEEWQTILNTISKCFKQYNIERPTPAYEAYDKAMTRISEPGCVTVKAPIELLEAWRAEELANDEAKMTELKQGFDLLFKWYQNLWD